MSEGRRRERHGQHRSKEYAAWALMKSRCSNPKNPAYPYYGGRGIRVCDRWIGSFAAFREDVGPAPSLEHSIDRLDVNGGYEPGNVRWATKAEQSQNTRYNHNVAVNGVSRCIHEWARVTGVSVQTVYVRVKRGWSWERAVSTPPDLSRFNRASLAARKEVDSCRKV